MATTSKATGSWAWLNTLGTPAATPVKTGTATGSYAWLNDLAKYDAEKNAALPFNAANAVVVKPKAKPVAYMNEAAKQRISAGLSLFGFGSFYSDRGRKDAAGATTKVATKPVAINGQLVAQKPGGLTTNQGLTAIAQPFGVVVR